jgi:tetratricopeptide (TPR) repeat protein
MLLKQAITEFQNQNYIRCLELLANIYQTSPDLFKIKSMSLKATGQFEKSLKCLAQACSEFPSDRELNILYYQSLINANLYSQCIQAIDGNRRLIKDESIHLFLATCYIKCTLLSKAEQILKNINKSSKYLEHWLLQEAEFLVQSARYIEAKDHLDSATTSYPNSFHLKYKYACLLKDLGDFDLAEKILTQLPQRYEPMVEVQYVKACLLYEAGKFTEAKTSLCKIISTSPFFIPAHESFAKIEQLTDTTKYNFENFQNAIKLPNAPIELTHSYLKQLFATEQYEEAYQVSKKALKIQSHEDIKHANSIAAYKLGLQAEATSTLHELIKHNPFNPRFAIDYANILLRTDATSSAAKLLEQAVHHNPFNQELWAYLGLAWRILGDPRHDWLNNYEDLVKVYELPTPPGYKDSESFFDSMNLYLSDLHNQKGDQPLDQSVKGGQQTNGHLLSIQDDLIISLRGSIEQRIKDYLKLIPDDSKHPLSQQKGKFFKLNGSWSVQLGTNGFHSNHIHPDGWISGPSYIALDENISPNDPTKSGWLKLGETSLGLDNEVVAKEICPKAGTIILFPSYMWHGTYPLTKPSKRLTVPCDIKPIF